MGRNGEGATVRLCENANGRLGENDNLTADTT